MECSEMKRRRKKLKRRRKKKMEECCVILPRDILIEILLRLPVKSLACFKCVSKLWLSLISDPSFARSHFDLALAPTHRILLSVEGGLEIPSIDFNAPSIHEYSTKILKPPIRKLSRFSYDPKSGDIGISGPIILGSCRGFMLIEFLGGFYIWNPCTGIQRRIPSPPVTGTEIFSGFGYDSSTDDYLVTIGYKDRHRVFVTIFSVRNNKWEQFKGIIPKILKYGIIKWDWDVGAGLLFNGANHWIVLNVKDSELINSMVIVAFDLTERVFFEIAMPDGFKATIDSNHELHVIGGFISVYDSIWVAYRDTDDIIHDNIIWVMEEYKVQSSWKRSKRSFPILPMYVMTPIYVTLGGDIVALGQEFELVKFNCEGELVERRDYYDDYPLSNPGRIVAFMHTHSLLSLPYHSLQAQE